MKTVTTNQEVCAMEKTHWACACIKRDPKTSLPVAIKLHPNSHKSCRVCGAKRDDNP